MNKTFTHHVQVQEKQKVSEEEVMKAQTKFKHECDFYTRRFKTKAAMYAHRTNCPYNYVTTDKAFEVEKSWGS